MHSSSSDPVPYPSDTLCTWRSMGQGQCVRGSRDKEENRFVFCLFCGADPFDVTLSHFIHPENLLCVNENWGSVSHLILRRNEELPIMLKSSPKRCQFSHHLLPQCYSIISSVEHKKRCLKKCLCYFLSMTIKRLLPEFFIISEYLIFCRIKKVLQGLQRYEGE